MEDLAKALGDALEAMLKALIALLLAFLMLLARAAQAIFTLARIALPLAATAAAGAGAVLLFPTILGAYGNDPPAALLALTAITATPTALLLLAQQREARPTPAGILAGSGVLMLLAHLAIERAPPVMLALAPPTGLAACIFYLAFGQPTDSKQEPNTSESERNTHDE